MDAIILVGGQGTRLRPLTLTRHKSLVPLCNRPAIEYLFDWARRGGFERVVLALGQHNEDLARAYPPGGYDGLRLVQVLETERLESGGAIRHAVREAGIDGRFVVLNGDVFFEVDFAGALARHIAQRAELTLALYAVQDPSQFGVAVVDKESMVTGFIEKPLPGTAPSNLVNAGLWIFEPGLVDEIPPGAVRVEETLFPGLVNGGRRVLGYQFDGLWADIGTRDRYLAINTAMIASGRDGIEPTAIVEPDAVVRLSSLGAHSSVGCNARVTESLLWEDVEVGAGATIAGSIVADNVTIGVGAQLTGVVIGSGCVVAPGAVLTAGAALEPGTRYDGVDER